MSKIDNYCIQAKNNINNNWYFITGFKTLPTMKKKFSSMLKTREILRKRYNIKTRESIRLVARDYNKNIIKVYQED